MGSSNTGGGKPDSSGEGGDARSDPSDSGSARPEPSYSEEETVLAFHGPLLYKAKVFAQLYVHISLSFFIISESHIDMQNMYLTLTVTS